MSTPEQDPFSAGGASAAPAWDAPSTQPGAGYGPPPGYQQQDGAQQQGGYQQQDGYGAPAYGYGPPPGAPAAAYGGPGAAPATSGKAIAALVCAIGSWALFPVIPAIVALVLAGQARAEIQAGGGRVSGAGLVTASKIVAWLNLAFFVLVILAVVAVFGLFATSGFSEGGTVTPG